MAMDARALQLIDELEALRASRNDAWQVPRVEGELLHQLALSMGALLVVEAGTSYGFSGLFWSAALRRTGGKLHTIDNDPKKFESSKATFARAEMGDIVTNYLGDARAVLPRMPGGIDIVFLDAGDKKQSSAYFDLVWEKVRPGGCVLTDNATTHRAELADYVKYVRSRPDTSSLEVAVGNGIEWTVKLRPE